MGRKRRRSLKKRLDEDEEVEVAGDSDYRPPISCSSPLMYNSPVQLRHSTRRAKAFLGEAATNNTSLRFPIRNVVKDIISQSSPWRPSGNVLAEEMDLSNPATSDILTSRKFNSEVAKIQVQNSVA